MSSGPIPEDDWVSVSDVGRTALRERMSAGRHMQAALSDDALVRTSVAGDPGAPADVLDRLVNDPSRHVLLNLLRNPELSGESLDAIVDRAVREGSDIALYAARSPSITPRSARALIDAGLGGALADNPSTPPDLLEEVYDAGCWSTRGIVVLNTACPNALRRRAAAADPYRHVRESAAAKLPPGEDPRVFATLDDLTPGRTVLIGDDLLGPSGESFLLDIDAVVEVDTSAESGANRDGVEETYVFHRVTLTGVRRRLDGGAAEPGGPVTVEAFLSNIQIPG